MEHQIDKFSPLGNVVSFDDFLRSRNSLATAEKRKPRTIVERSSFTSTNARIDALVTMSFDLQRALTTLATMPSPAQETEIFYLLEADIGTKAKPALEWLSRFAKARLGYDCRNCAKDDEKDS